MAIALLKEKIIRTTYLHMISRIREDIVSIMERDPAARSSWEVLTCYPGLHAVVLHRCAHWCWGRGFKWGGRFISHVARWLTGIEIHPGAVIGRRVFIDHGFGVVIGETAVVGDDCTIYQGVTLGGTSLHKGGKRHPTLERGAIIGAGAKVLGAFTVGEGAKVGSNAVVVKAVPPGATAVGNPAHVVQESVGRQREEAAARVFAAYGLTPGEDPMASAMHRLIDHAAAQEQRIEQLIAALQAMGVNCENISVRDKLDPAQLNRMVD